MRKGATIVPLLGNVCNKDSEASLTIASLTGERDTPNRLARFASSSNSLGCKVRDGVEVGTIDGTELANKLG